MSDDVDIVDRLRISWTSMTAMVNAEREEAADEIERLRAGLAAAIKQRDEARDYSIALQRAIEHHRRGVAVPPAIAADCPHHAQMLNEHLASDAYRGRYHKALAASVWKPGTRWQTYPNPQRSDGLFVATVGDLVRPYQAVPDGCLSLRCQLPHDDAEAVVKLLNEWTESDARRAKESTDER